MHPQCGGSRYLLAGRSAARPGGARGTAAGSRPGADRPGLHLRTMEGARSLPRSDCAASRPSSGARICDRRGGVRDRRKPVVAGRTADAGGGARALGHGRFHRPCRQCAGRASLAGHRRSREHRARTIRDGDRGGHGHAACGRGGSRRRSGRALRRSGERDWLHAGRRRRARRAAGGAGGGCHAARCHRGHRTVDGDSTGSRPSAWRGRFERPTPDDFDRTVRRRLPALRLHGP